MRWRIVIFAFVLAGVFAYWGYQETVLMAGASSKPEEISLLNLIKRGVAGNRNVLLKDFSFSDNYVYTQKKNGSRYEKVWLPIVLPNTEATAKEIQVLILSERLNGEADVTNFVKQHESAPVQGLLVNEVHDLDSLARGTLVKSYPQTNFDKCLIVHEGREPAAMFKLVSLFAASIVFFLAALGAMFLWR